MMAYDDARFLGPLVIYPEQLRFLPLSRLLGLLLHKTHVSPVLILQTSADSFQLRLSLLSQFIYF
jgi:hypothetical protein